ncbi:MAG: ATP-binding cassette domain-containing protein, partial [Acidobacteria bacterium]|nr:ATP-binding cassette domain-containing protein [Acidobacteriota bacterium]
FSAGMRKRLILARSRLENPRLLLLDEPFASLDPEGQSLVERWVGRFVDDGGTLIVASHAIERASRLCRRAVLLEQGQVAWQGDASALEATWARRLGR